MHTRLCPQINGMTTHARDPLVSIFEEYLQRPDRFMMHSSRVYKEHRNHIYYFLYMLLAAVKLNHRNHKKTLVKLKNAVSYILRVIVLRFREVKTVCVNGNTNFQGRGQDFLLGGGTKLEILEKILIFPKTNKKGINNNK